MIDSIENAEDTADYFVVSSLIYNEYNLTLRLDFACDSNTQFSISYDIYLS